jgi:hypothetical protein
VRLSNRVRLAATVLAASEWPAYEHARAGNGPAHPQAEATRSYIGDYAEHPAVQQINALLPTDLNLGDLFSTVVRCQWPTLTPQEPLPGRFADGVWAGQLGDFYVETAVAAFFWSDHEAVWLEAERDLRHIFPDNSMTSLLSALAGRDIDRAVTIVPNLIYPATETIVADNAEAYYVVVPPPAGKGEAAPRSYRESAGWVLAAVCYALTPLFLETTLAQLTPEKAGLLRYAVTATFVENVSDDKAAALFYRVHCKNELGLEQIDEAIDAVRAFLAQPQEAGLARLFSAGE